MARRPLTRSAIGRSCMRATPRISTQPPVCDKDATIAGSSVRIVRPELPINNCSGACTDPVFGNRPATPLTSKTLSSSFGCGWAPALVGAPGDSPNTTPSFPSESIMTRVSSESSTRCNRVTPSASAASRSIRLEMLLLPGSTTSPQAAARGVNTIELG